MKTMAAVAFLLCLASAVLAESPQKSALQILPDLMTQANAETVDNAIPWFSQKGDADIQIKGTLVTEDALVRTVQGDYVYTLSRCTFAVTEVQKGAMEAKGLIFFVERKFPTPESRIMYKALPPFRKDTPLIFKLSKGAERYLITSIEK